MNPQEKRQVAMKARGFVAVDAGKFEHTLVVRTRKGADSKPFPFKTTRPEFDGAAAFIAKQLPGIPPSEILVGIEFAGSYGFTLAHYLQQLGFPVVSVLPAHTKRQKEITHNQALKTDAKDAISIADLLVQGKFVSFPFLNTVYADLRYLVSAREHVAVLKNAALTRLLAVLDIVFPEYGSVFSHIDQPTALAILKQYPGPDAILRAKKRSVVAVLKRESRGHLGEKRYETLCAAARATLALPGAQGVLADELALIIARLEVFTAQLETLKQRMIAVMEATPEAKFLLTIPGVQPVTAATFLGSIGDPQAYESAKQVLKVAGLSLVERSSGIHKGKERISKRGRPTLRRHAFMFALRGIREDGMYRADFERLLANNGGKKMPAIVAISRKGLKLMFRIAKERRPYVPMEEMPGHEPAATMAIPVAAATKEVTP